MFLFFPVLRRGSSVSIIIGSLYTFLFFPVLRRGSADPSVKTTSTEFLFFPVLRRGSHSMSHQILHFSFYSSPSCDGDHSGLTGQDVISVSILPRLATGINRQCMLIRTLCFYSSPSCDGDPDDPDVRSHCEFLFFPVLRRGSPEYRPVIVR